MVETHLIFSSLLAAVNPQPPPSLAGAPLLSLPSQHHSSPTALSISPTASRRSASLLILLSISAIRCPSAAAFSLGTSGPKEWLKDRKRKASRFLLAPIEASRGSLQNASLILTSSTESQVEATEEIRRLIGSASRDCIVGQRNSIVAFQARTGVEVCTFSLLVKNAASLLDDIDPVKLETKAMLDELIRSFTSLGDLVDSSDLQLTSGREKVEAGLRETISALDNFERGIKNCIDI